MQTNDGFARVLLVDDNRDVVESLARVLELNGLQVDKAYDGETALGRARTLDPDVVVLDLLLPKIDGYLLAQALRNDARCGRAFLIAYTGDATDAARLRCATAGIDSYVLKPADPRELCGLIQRARSAQRGTAPVSSPAPRVRRVAE